MLRDRLYYQVKPYVPWHWRMALRRRLAERCRRRSQAVWPINEKAGTPPVGWPGWPEEKNFAVVLTHDVEGEKGLTKCRQLMQLEIALGFRSSFNLVPEGEYRVPPELRAELAQNDFEVGVHDLHHDGKLYRNRDDFREKAARVNHYLREWGAVGFRSGFMLRNLEWFHDVEALYDASTFDTDPFEPQPGGAGTIFPFWVPGANGSGYVELPYTLPQDSTLFLVLQETSPAIWLKKLDWVAERGGMALVNVHPDYMRFPGEPDSARTFPASHYATLLQHIRERYGNTYWQPLPRELAAFAAALKPALRPPQKRVCLLSHSYYSNDARVNRYAEALAERGDHVDVLALRRAVDGPAQETRNGVNVFYLQPRTRKNERSQLSFLLPVLRFLSMSAWWIAREHHRHRYDVFHVHNVPDFLVFAAAYPRWTGAKVILDIHDILPEFYASKFNKPADSRSVRLLKRMERASAKMADQIIIANHLWLEKYAQRTGTNGRCSVFINNVDGRLFRAGQRTRDDNRIIILFPGGLQWHQGLDIAIRAFSKVSAQMPQAEFHIYGDGNMKDSLVALTGELGLQEKVRFFNSLPVQEVMTVMANADLGVVPKRADSFGNEAYSTKIMEFMSLGVPVVVSNTKIDRYYFDDSVVRFFESGNADALAAAMIAVLRDEPARRQMTSRALEYAAQNSWQRRKGDYLALVDSLLDS